MDNNDYSLRDIIEEIESHRITNSRREWPDRTTLAFSAKGIESAIKDAFEVLEYIEWSGAHQDGTRMCPWCCSDPIGGHFAGCKLNSLLLS